jgi:hypothetical protein
MATNSAGLPNVDLQRLLLVVAEQQRAIEHLTERVDELERQKGEPASSGPPPAEPSPVDWLRISGQERLMAWRGLANFVEALIFRYNMQTEVRACWWQHTEAVEELTALWHMRQVLYRQGSTLRDAMAWQDNFYKSRDRLRYMFSACGDYHVDGTVKKWMTDADRAAFIESVRSEVL